MIQSIQFIVLLVVLLLYFYGFYRHDKYNWLRAVILALGFSLLSILANKFGFIGSLLAFIGALVMTMKVARKGFASSFLFLLILALVMQVISIGLIPLIK